MHSLYQKLSKMQIRLLTLRNYASNVGSVSITSTLNDAINLIEEVLLYFEGQSGSDLPDDPNPEKSHQAFLHGRTS